MARSARADQLLDAALAEWSERGYAAVGVKEITERAQVSHGTFYNYFDNRRQMLDVLVERESADYLAQFDRAAQDMVRPVTEESLREVIVSVTAETLRGMRDRAHPFAFVLLDVAGIDSEALAGQVALFRDAGSRAGAILANAVADGLIDPSVSIEFAGQAWISAMLGVIAPVVADDREIGDLEQVARTLADALLHGVPEPDSGE